MSGRTVKIYLVDGIPSGLMTAEIMNWTGKVTVAPRSQLGDLTRREDIKRTGVYILSGENPDNPSQEQVYIGESENVLERLAKHNTDRDKDFWRRTVIVTSKDANLTKAHIKYLESRLIQIASEAQRARLANGTNPEVSNLPESDIADMEYFLDQIQMLLPVLGLNFALPLPTRDQMAISEIETNIQSPVFHLSYAGVDAYAQEINGEFVVFKDSTVRKTDTPSFSDSYKQMRRNLLAEGKLTDSNSREYWVMTQNVPFPSPSTAANVITGTRLNGREVWRVQDTEQTYNEWLESQIQEIGSFDEEDS